MLDSSAVRRGLTIVAATLVLAALTVLTAPRAFAATYVVTRFDDPAPNGCNPGDCSLREAILAANASLGIPDTVQLGAGPYVLSIPGTGEDGAADGDLDVTNDPLTIVGKGSAATIIDGGGAGVGETVFTFFVDTTMTGVAIMNSVVPGSISGIRVAMGVTLNLTGAEISGHASLGAGCCAGVTYDTGSTLNFTDVTVRENSAGTGCCAGFVGTGTLNLANVSITDNTSAECCAGIVGSGTAALDNVEITRNVSNDTCCAGLALNGGPFNLNHVDISNNTSGAACCAGLVIDASVPSMITNTSVTGNRANGTSTTGNDCCAGIYGNGPFTLRNVTVSGNMSQDCCAGIVAGSGTWNLNNVTSTANASEQDNQADGSPSGLAGITQLGGTVTIGNTLAAGNSIGAGSSGPDCYGTIASNGYNLIGIVPGTCAFAPATGDKVGGDPKVGPVGDNGGFVPTVPLLKGSPAINAGNPAAPGSGGTSCEATDARGLPRNCDIGAYELTLCRKVPVNRIGTIGKDKLRGTSGADGLLGFGRKDTLRGKGGKDGLCGGAGKDLLKGGGGKDILDGGPGKDRCIGQAGKDKAKACEEKKTIP